MGVLCFGAEKVKDKFKGDLEVTEMWSAPRFGRFRFL
jgi:hypothetical protein